ncbi:MAG: MTH938/NDUFAF3 family protein [Patescibacteria group bacterium]
MVKIDSCGWGNIVVNGRQYHEVLIVREKVEPRDDERLEKELGTDHLIGGWEQELLMRGNPEVIIIGTGQAGVLKVLEEVKEKLVNSGAEIKILLTPQAVSEFNRLASEGKKVNALIHTTC